jgi:hypothetical protein
MSIAVSAFLPLAIGCDFDSRPAADASSGLSGLPGVNRLLEMALNGDGGSQLEPEFGIIMGVESSDEGEGEEALACEETALIAPSRRRRPKFI